MIKLEPPVDKEKYKEIPKGLSDYEKNKPCNDPTHFTMVLQTEGRYKGYDKVTYYRKKV